MVEVVVLPVTCRPVTRQRTFCAVRESPMKSRGRWWVCRARMFVKIDLEVIRSRRIVEARYSHPNPCDLLLYEALKANASTNI